MGDADSRMPSVREIFGSGEPDNEDHDPDAEDHESDARLSGSHGMFGSSDRLFVGVHNTRMASRYLVATTGAASRGSHRAQDLPAHFE